MTLAELLAAHHPADEKETADLREMRGFAASLSAPFSREQWPAHFTGSAVVVTPDGTKVCLVLHAKLKRWLQPGGHADVADGGNMEKTALREAREETGCEVELHPTAPRPLDVDVHVIPGSPVAPPWPRPPLRSGPGWSDSVRPAPLQRKSEPEHRHLDVRYLVVARNPEALAHDPNESHGAQWLTWEEAIARADEAPLRRLLEKARAVK